MAQKFHSWQSLSEGEWRTVGAFPVDLLKIAMQQCLLFSDTGDPSAEFRSETKDGRNIITITAQNTQSNFGAMHVPNVFHSCSFLQPTCLSLKSIQLYVILQTCIDSRSNDMFWDGSPILTRAVREALSKGCHPDYVFHVYRDGSFKICHRYADKSHAIAFVLHANGAYNVRSFARDINAPHPDEMDDGMMLRLCDAYLEWLRKRDVFHLDWRTLYEVRRQGDGTLALQVVRLRHLREERVGQYYVHVLDEPEAIREPIFHVVSSIEEAVQSLLEDSRVYSVEFEDVLRRELPIYLRERLKRSDAVRLNLTSGLERYKLIHTRSAYDEDCRHSSIHGTCV